MLRMDGQKLASAIFPNGRSRSRITSDIGIFSYQSRTM